MNFQFQQLWIMRPGRRAPSNLETDVQYIKQHIKATIFVLTRKLNMFL